MQAARAGRSAAGSSHRASAAPFVGHDLLGVPAVAGGERRDRGRLVRIAAGGAVERGFERVAQPRRQPAGDDVHGVVGVARAHDGVAVVAQAGVVGVG